MIWQVVPVARLWCVRSVFQQFKAQNHESKKLCLVVNGCGSPLDVEEHLKQQEVTPDLLLHSEAHPQLGKPWALNKALSELKGEIVALRDDDDIQGPNDLAEAMEAFWVTGATLVTKHPHQVLINDERWLFAESLANQWAKLGDTYDTRISGSNVLFRNRDVPEFPLVPSGEVRKWAHGLVQEGATIWRTSTDNYTWVRGKHEHRWRATKASVRDDYGRGLPARRYLPDGTFEWVEPPTIQEIMDDFGNWV